jgi:Sec-independent protein translocase protein TatA
MEILGIGTSEIIFILLIAITVLGPKDMMEAGRTVGKWMRRILMSDAWMVTQQISREAKKQWFHFIREANEDLQTIRKETGLAEQGSQSGRASKMPTASANRNTKSAKVSTDLSDASGMGASKDDPNEAV